MKIQIVQMFVRKTCMCTCFGIKINVLKKKTNILKIVSVAAWSKLSWYSFEDTILTKVWLLCLASHRWRENSKVEGLKIEIKKTQNALALSLETRAPLQFFLQLSMCGYDHFLLILGFKAKKSHQLTPFLDFL